MDLEHFVNNFNLAKANGAIKMEGGEGEAARNEILKFTEKMVNDFTIRLVFRINDDHALVIFDDLEGCQRSWTVEGYQGIEHLLDHEGFWEETIPFLCIEKPYVFAFLTLYYPRFAKLVEVVTAQV